MRALFQCSRPQNVECSRMYFYAEREPYKVSRPKVVTVMRS